MKFFLYFQYAEPWHFTPPACSVLIEAASADEADRKAIEYGADFNDIYPDAAFGRIHRWRKTDVTYDKDTIEKLESHLADVSGWNDGIPDFLIVYAHGRTVSGFTVPKRYAA